MEDNVIEGLQTWLSDQQRAFTTEPARSLVARRQDLRVIEALVNDHASDWVEAVSADFGHRAEIETRLLELSIVAQGTRNLRRNLARWMKPERVPTPLMLQPGRAWVRRDPRGVVGIVSPWNYPVQLALLPLATALAAGNRVMLKPSELTPRTNDLMTRVLGEVFPMEQVRVVHGGAQVAEAFCDLGFDHLFYTGSTRIGRHVAAAAGANLVPVTLELGGKSPAIVSARYPVADAAHAIAWGRFLNAGQTCVAVDHVLAIGGPERAVELGQAVAAKVQEFYPDFVNNPDYSSLISGQHFDRLIDLVDEARSAGAQVIQPDHDRDLARLQRRFAPTVIINPPAGLRLMQEEIFGPILPVLSQPDLAQTCRTIEEQGRPLALYIFSQDQREVERVLDHTHSGGVTINGTMLHLANDNLPFGGNGPSGQGAYHGRFGFEELTHARAVFKIGRWHPTRLMAPPYGRQARFIADLAAKL